MSDLYDEWLYGWKAIASHCNTTVKTAKIYHKKYGMTVRRGPRNKPIALRAELNGWLVEFDQAKKNAKIDE